MIRGALILALGLVTGGLQAQEYIETRGPLSDRDFYRLVACGADPGAECRKTLARWPKPKARNLSVGIVRQDATFPSTNAQMINAALQSAIDEIVNLDAGVVIRRKDTRPDISVLLMDHPEQTELTGTGVPDLDGNFMEAAYVHIWWNGSQQITRGVIVMTPHVEQSSIRSVMLEELVQSLGLLTDIQNPHYSDLSIFDQNSNAVTRLRGQDAMAIKMHYTR